MPCAKRFVNTRFPFVYFLGFYVLSMSNIGEDVKRDRESTSLVRHFKLTQDFNVALQHATRYCPCSISPHQKVCCSTCILFVHTRCFSVEPYFCDSIWWFLGQMLLQHLNSSLINHMNESDTLAQTHSYMKKY